MRRDGDSVQNRIMYFQTALTALSQYDRNSRHPPHCAYMCAETRMAVNHSQLSIIKTASSPKESATGLGYLASRRKSGLEKILDLQGSGSCRSGA
jgi:hypothetical protein